MNTTPHHNKSFADDQRKYRKIRKYLRQIEHLQLLTRDLNDEEKLKVKRKKHYREQLNSLTSKYANDELFFDNETTALNESTVSARHEVSVTSQAVQEEVEKAEEEKERFEAEVDNLAVELNDKLSVESVDEQIAPAEAAEVKTNETRKKKINNAEKKAAVVDVSETVVKPKVEKVKVTKVEPAKPFVVFETFKVEEAHEDLIVSVDVCTESNMVVTGSRDTTLKVWSIEEANKIKLLHSFGGHSSPITCVRFWQGKFFRACLERISKQDESEALSQSIISPDGKCSKACGLFAFADLVCFCVFKMRKRF